MYLWSILDIVKTYITARQQVGIQTYVVCLFLLPNDDLHQVLSPGVLLKRPIMPSTSDKLPEQTCNPEYPTSQS